MPALYIVATPIGNLEDITLRALRTLREVSLIAAEDTRSTRHLLSRYEISTPLTSYHEHNKKTKLEYLLGKLAEGDVALVSEAGTPGFSDPGYELITTAIERGIEVVSVPGASIVITAMVASGLPVYRGLFLGFLPNKSSARRRVLQEIVKEPGTLLILEAPHRLVSSLHDILEVLGDRRVAVCREMTKLHEEIFRGMVSQALAHFTQPRGEFTIVIEGFRGEGKPEVTGEIESRLEKLYRQGLKAKEAVALLAGETGISRRELYNAWLRQNRKWKQPGAAKR